MIVSCETNKATPKSYYFLLHAEDADKRNLPKDDLSHQVEDHSKSNNQETKFDQTLKYLS